MGELSFLLSSSNSTQVNFYEAVYITNVKSTFNESLKASKQ